MHYLYFRNTYDYERKLRVDHSESLQTMKRNYDSMVTELEKLRAELRDTSNLDKSGMEFCRLSVISFIALYMLASIGTRFFISVFFTMKHLYV